MFNFNLYEHLRQLPQMSSASGLDPTVFSLDKKT